MAEQEKGVLAASKLMRRIPQRCSSEEYLIVAIVTILAYFLAYLTYPATPANGEDQFAGWFGWNDQQRYLQSAQAIAHGSLSAQSYVYPLGYPLMAVPFLKALPRHPFLVPNLLLTTGIVLAFYASCRKFLTQIESALLTFLLIICSAFASTKAISGGLIWSDSLIVPWNDIPVFFAAYLATWLLVFNTANFASLWLVSVVIAVAFFSRPTDISFLGILYLAGIPDLRGVSAKLRGLLVLAIPSLMILSIVLVSKWLVFHALVNEYDLNNANIGINPSDLPFKIYGMFFDGSPINGYKERMLLPQMPWLALSGPGMVFLAKRTQGKSWYLVAAILTCLVLYVSYNALTPSNAFNYLGFRYFVWVFPWLGLCAYLTITRAPVHLGMATTIGGFVAGLVIVALVGWRESEVGVIFADSNSGEQPVFSKYDSVNKTFVASLELKGRERVDGFRLTFVSGPSVNMSVAGDWQRFSMTVDGVKQSLYRDYNLFQSGRDIFVAMRNPVNGVGSLKRAQFVFVGTDAPIMEKIVVLRKEFESFGFLKHVVLGGVIGHPDWLSILPERWLITADQAYLWGTVVTMGSGGTAGPYKLKGWAGDEPGFTWTEGRRAELGFQTAGAPGAVALTLNAAGLRSPKPQVVLVSVNRRNLAEVNMAWDRRDYEVVIPPEYLRSDGKLLIGFDLPNAISPVEFGMNQDVRLLGMAVWSFEISERK